MMTDMNGVLGFSQGSWSGAIATAVIALSYAFARRGVHCTETSGNPWSPLVVTAGVYGRASLSNLQILFFSLIVFWVLLYALLLAGTLGSLSKDVLLLLGIGGAGTAGSRIVAIQRQRLSFANWAWLRHKGWIQQDIGPARRPPRWADLITSDDCFDVFKFQNLAVTLIVGIALLLAGLAAKQGADPSQALASFKIDGTLLGLLGLSQAAYVGGKAVAPGPVTELNQKLDQVRDLERKFEEAVATAWTATPPPSRDQAWGQAAAPAAYQAYLAAANEAMTMVDERIGGRHPTARIEPDLP